MTAPVAHQPPAVVRVTRFRATPGGVESLTAAARSNAADARRQRGCLTAEVCTPLSTRPDGDDEILVVSRWESTDALEAFLGWHEQSAHRSVAPFMDGPPQAQHYAVVAE